MNPDLHSIVPPPFFYRVQHRNSHTTQTRGRGGFSNRGNRYTNDGHINVAALHQHLDPDSKSWTPFISVFENEENATNSAQQHWERGDQDIRIVQLDTSWLLPVILQLRCEKSVGGRTHMLFPAWRALDGATFFSTADARKYLGMRDDVGQREEWFALGWIPGEMVVDVKYPYGRQSWRCALVYEAPKCIQS